MIAEKVGVDWAAAKNVVVAPGVTELGVANWVVKSILEISTVTLIVAEGLSEPRMVVDEQLVHVLAFRFRNVVVPYLAAEITHGFLNLQQWLMGQLWAVN